MGRLPSFISSALGSGLDVVQARQNVSLALPPES